MDKLDLKEKFKTFLTDSKQKLLSPSNEDQVEADTCLPPATMLQQLDRLGWSDSDWEVSQLKPDLQAEGELLEALDRLYFQPDSDPSLHCLQLLGDQLDQVDTIDRARKELLAQLTAVSRRVFSLILDTQADCASQLEHIVEVQADLLDSLSTCKTGRAGLARAQRQFVNCSLGILARCRRRQQASLLLQDLETIKTLSLTQERLVELLAEEDFPQAISVILECVKVASNYKHFTAIRQLSSKLSDTLVMTEEQLDSALSKQCHTFQPEVYSRLQEAYQLLGKTQTATDQLLMHFTTCIHNTCWQVVYGHVCLVTDCPRPPPFPELCREVVSSSFLPCLTDMLRALWGVMVSYHGLVQWHRTHHWIEESNEESEEVEEGESGRQYTRNKLEAGLGRIWQDVQIKVKQYVLSSDLSQFSIDSFLHFLDLIHRLIMVGKEFSDNRVSADLLQDSLQSQCLAYFHSYHTSRLDELRVHLENEAWTMCPVKPSFSFQLLAEFSHLSVLKSPSKSLSGSSSWFLRFRPEDGRGSPFDELCQESLEEDILIEEAGQGDSDSEDDLSEEQKQELVEENRDVGRTLSGISPVKSSGRVVPKMTPSVGLTVSNSAIMLLRLVGRYSHMMKVLTPIADTVWRGICQLFQFYIYSVHTFFTRDLPHSISQTVHTSRLNTALATIFREVVEHEVQVEEGDNRVRLVGCVQEASLCPGVSLQGRLAGLQERMVGVESTVFLAGQLVNLQPYLESALGLGNRDLVSEFYLSFVETAVDLRAPVYLSAVSRCLDSSSILTMMSRVSWDQKEVVTQHSSYVDQLLTELTVFSSRLATLSIVTEELKRMIWQQVVIVTNNVFVEGFALAKKCTNEGRALMQLDFRQFVLKCENLCGLKPLPSQDFVTAYIKAYYIPETDLEGWMKQHSEYSATQLRSLVASVTYNNNKTKQKLNSLINDLSDRIRR